MQRLSVILCSHNPQPAYLSRVLASLRAQSLPAAKWELLLIDNGSDQPLAGSWDISWHPFVRILREEELGLTFARLRGIKESGGELLVFVDDDNVLSPDFLDLAIKIATRYPVLGAFGAGILEPEYETQPPLEIRPRLNLLALRSVSAALWSNDPQDLECIPWGAGLCVTRSVADFYRQFITDLGITEVLGRRGQRLFSGEDEVFSWAAAEVDLGFGIFPELRITHLISAARLNRRYFLRLIHDHALSKSVLTYLLEGKQRRRTDILRPVRMVGHAKRNGLFSMQCRWAESRGEDHAARFISANRLKPVELRQNSVGRNRERFSLHQPAPGCSDFAGGASGIL